MRGFFELVRRFHRDERGVFAVLFGVIAIVLIAAAGAVVDFTRIELARARAQQALDSAALGMQPKIYDTVPATTASKETLRVQAKALLDERLADTTMTTTVSTPTIDTTEGKLRLDASITMKTAFVALIGIPQVTAKIASEATRKRLRLEVAMVLDNSNSMSSSSRMTNLIAAAKCAANILFNSDCSSTATTSANSSVFIGIVPFTLAVNVGPSNANAAWIDKAGTNATISRDNFDNDDNDAVRTITAFDRIATIASMKDSKGKALAWGGCVESRIHDTTNNLLYDTDDTPPSTSTPNSMFTPYFAPDEPDAGFNNDYVNDRTQCTNKDQGSWSKKIEKTTCTGTANDLNGFNNLSCSGNTTTTTTQKDTNGNTVTPAASAEPETVNGQPKKCTDTFTNSRTQTGPSRYTNTYVRSCSYTFSDRELQERICKYNGATATGLSQGSVIGPNGDCPTNAIQPLTSTKADVTTSINALAAQGGTNIHAGVEWGFRVLSPTAPFTEGAVYSTAATSKIMIVMTDGENTAYPTGNMNNATFYGSYAFPYNVRLGSMSSSEPDLETEMNTRTVQTCNNAKDQGIEVFTIGLSTDQTDHPAENTQMLKDCSSGTGYWYFPTQSSDLINVFSDIAKKLANLRLAK